MSRSRTRVIQGAALLGVALLAFSVFTPHAAGAQEEGLVGIRLLAVATEAEAADLRDRIAGGASFETLARQYSRDPTAANGGYLGLFAPTDLRPEFQDALSGLGPGELSPVRQLGDGYVLFQLLTENEQEWVSARAEAESAFRGRRYDAAAALYETAAELAGTFDPPASRLADSLYDLAGVRFIQGRFADAVEAYRRYMAARWAPAAPEGAARFAGMVDDLAAILTLADFADEEFDQARARFESAVAEIPLSEDAYVGMGSMLQLAELDDLAATVLRRGVEVFGESKLLGFTLGELHFASGDSLEALEAFERARAIRGESELDRLQNAYIARRMGNTLVLLGRPDDALMAYLDSIELDPDSLETRLSLADLYTTRNDLDDALAQLERAREIGPDDAGVFAGLSEVHLNGGRFADAVEAADRALELDPSRDRVRYVRGQALMRLGRREEGQAELTRYQELTPNDPNTGDAPTESVRDVVRRAAGLLAEGRSEAALELLETTSEARPQEILPRLALGIAERKAGLEDAALETLQATADAGFNDLMLQRNLAVAYERRDDPAASEHRAAFLQMLDLAFKELSN